MAADLQNQFEKLSNQARFIQMIVSKELVISNRKKADVVQELRKHEFRPFPKITKAKAAGETAPTVEEEEIEAAEREEEETGTTTDFDYLLQMSISSLTKEKVRYRFSGAGLISDGFMGC